MRIGEVIEIALANVDRRRVETTVLEGADIQMEVVGGIAQLVTELVDNAIEFSEPDQGITITGGFDRDDYLISISDNGVGIPTAMVAALNEVLAHPGGAGTPSGSMGIATVARLAARHDLAVRLIPANPGTTAQINVPARLVSAEGHPEETRSEVSPTPPAREVTPPRMTPMTETHHVVAMSDSARREAEEFLEQVFGPVRGQTVSRGPMSYGSNGNGHAAAVETRPTPVPGPKLQTRIPGENFQIADDDRSTSSGESAVDIRLNLARFDEGRRAARDEPRS